MTSNLDICRAANEVVKRYGEAADIEAAMRTHGCLSARDTEGEVVWPQIVKAVEELSSEQRRDDADVHWPGSCGTVSLSGYGTYYIYTFFVGAWR